MNAASEASTVADDGLSVATTGSASFGSSKNEQPNHLVSVVLPPSVVEVRFPLPVSTTEEVASPELKRLMKEFDNLETRSNRMEQLLQEQERALATKNKEIAELRASKHEEIAELRASKNKEIEVKNKEIEVLHSANNKKIEELHRQLLALHRQLFEKDKEIWVLEEKAIYQPASPSQLGCKAAKSQVSGESKVSSVWDGVSEGSGKSTFTFTTEFTVDAVENMYTDTAVLGLQALLATMTPVPVSALFKTVQLLELIGWLERSPDGKLQKAPGFGKLPVLEDNTKPSKNWFAFGLKLYGNKNKNKKRAETKEEFDC